MCWPSSDTIVPRSGRVAPDSHNRDPTKDCIVCLICGWTIDGCFSDGMLSTACHDRYGVFTVFVFVFVSPASSIKLSANASCVIWTSI